MAQIGDKKKKKKKKIELVKDYPVVNYNDVRDAVVDWMRRVNEKGSHQSKCMILKYERDQKANSIKSIDKSCPPMKYGHPRQVVFLNAHHWKPKAPYCISHQCGEFYCINVAHYVVELKNINLNVRVKCHNAIDRWLRNNKGLIMRDSQWTVRKCKLCKGGTPIVDDDGNEIVCKCSKTHPCFRSVGDAALEFRW